MHPIMDQQSLAQATDSSSALVTIERQQQTIHALSQAHQDLVRALSHDLRAPVRHMLAFAPLLKESADAVAQVQCSVALNDNVQELQEFVDAIARSAQKMAAMVDGLTDWLRCQSQALHIEEIDLLQLLKQALARHAFEGEQVKVIVETDQTTVNADRELLVQVLDALLSNACKFRHIDKKLLLKINIWVEENNKLMLRFQDNGVGCSERICASAVGLFKRWHSEKFFSGLGVGLAKVVTIVQRHHGSVSIKSSPNEGFEINIGFNIR